jgi:hypothetical protein
MESMVWSVWRQRLPWHRGKTCAMKQHWWLVQSEGTSVGAVVGAEWGSRITNVRVGIWHSPWVMNRSFIKNRWKVWKQKLKQLTCPSYISWYGFSFNHFEKTLRFKCTLKQGGVPLPLPNPCSPFPIPSCSPMSPNPSMPRYAGYRITW